MKSVLAFAFLLFSAVLTNAQTLYSKSFGDKKNEPIIFLHGGPGNSAVYFEATTAQKLAYKGFYVIIYDRRGEGRSADKNAEMNFQEAFDDLNFLYKKYNLSKANLIGFSFGGLVTTLFASKYPGKIKSIVLTSALVSQQESYNTILRNTKHIYAKNGDQENLEDLTMIEKMDKNSLEYRTGCFKHASANGFFKVQNPNELAKKIYATYETDPLITKYVKNEKSVPTFWKNETLKNIDISNKLKKLRAQNTDIYGLYGKQDGLYSKKQIADLQEIIGADHLKYLDNCSHTLFIDQQIHFLSAVQQWLK